MNLSQLLHLFFVDAKVELVLALIALDVVLGVLAAIEHGTFRLAYLAQFAKDDLLGKVVPWFVVYSADKVASASFLGTDVIAVAAGTVFAAVTVGMVGSITSSLADLGFNLPTALGAGEKPATGDAAVVPPAR